LKRRRREAASARPLVGDNRLLKPFGEALRFTLTPDDLTPDQREAIKRPSRLTWLGPTP
jgi:hypothetical protein